MKFRNSISDDELPIFVFFLRNTKKLEQSFVSQPRIHKVNLTSRILLQEIYTKMWLLVWKRGGISVPPTYILYVCSVFRFQTENSKSKSFCFWKLFINSSFITHNSHYYLLQSFYYRENKWTRELKLILYKLFLLSEYWLTLSSIKTWQKKYNNLAVWNSILPTTYVGKYLCLHFLWKIIIMDIIPISFECHNLT